MTIRRKAEHSMLLGEAIIAEILGGVLLSYTAIRHTREGVALAALIAGFVFLAAIPLTAALVH